MVRVVEPVGRDSSALDQGGARSSVVAGAAGDGALLALARGFVDQLAALDRRYRKAAITHAPADDRAATAAAFWALMAAVDRRVAEHGDDPALARELRAIVGPWLWRSRYWNRSFHKPHGHAGDFVIIEWMYDLEGAGCDDPLQPAIVNLLDHLYWTVDSVQAVCERRRWFATLLADEERRGGARAVLDVAAGGGRYLRDHLERCARPPALTVVDQDPAAIAFCRDHALAPWLASTRLVCAPVRALTERVHGAFDVIISAGLFDYLDDRAATALLAALGARLEPGGVLAISNFAPEDRSATTKTWLVDWPLRFRDEAACRALFPPSLAVACARSTNRSLVHAWARRGEPGPAPALAR